MRNLTATFLGALAILAWLPVAVLAEDDDDRGGRGSWVVTDKTTAAECSACHMAYPPAFLPKRSWQKIMSDLANHFGEDASLDASTARHIEKYLVANSPRDIRGVKSGETPMRITELRWFAHEHGRRTRKRAETNPNIGSLSNCTACHRGAERGYFEDD